MQCRDSSHAMAAVPAEALQSAAIRKVLRPQPSQQSTPVEFLITPLVVQVTEVYAPFNTSLIAAIL